MVDADPTGVLASDPGGTVVYANPAAAAALDGMELVGQPVERVLAGLVAATANPVDVGGGMTAWYLVAETPSSLNDLRFAAEVGDALAGSLNLRRTLRRLVDLAVPALGLAASVTMRNDDELRRVAVTADGADDRFVSVAGLGEKDRKELERMMSAASTETVAASPEALERLGFGPLARDPSALLGPVVVLPLRAHGQNHGLLSVVTSGETAGMAGLEALARRGAVAIAAAEVYEERSRLAEMLRSALKPAPIPEIKGMQIAASYRSAQEAAEIGGDFYEVCADGDGWSATIGDVCGKGVEAAVLTGQVRQSLRAVSLVTDDPVRRLELLNQAMLDADGSSFVTLVHAVMKPAGSEVDVRLATGGHPPAMLRRQSGDVGEVDAVGPIVGMLPEVRFEPSDFRIRPGETLLCYTDGLIEAKGSAGFFGPERVAALLGASVGMTASAICERLMQKVIEHLDGRPHDDIAILAVQVEPPP